MSRTPQLALAFDTPPGRGGRRRGAGRKARGDRPGVSHHGRPAIDGTTPAHVSLRMLPHVWNLRSRRAFTVVERALAGMTGRAEFRIVHFSVEGNHVHLLVEADDPRALSEGVQGLCVRLAKGLNGTMGRRGKVLADRFHARVLRTPAEVRRALAYVLLNHSNHLARAGEPVPAGFVDPFSSAATLEELGRSARPESPRVTSPPRSWLLATGWRRAGPLGLPRAIAGRARAVTAASGGSRAAAPGAPRAPGGRRRRAGAR